MARIVDFFDGAQSETTPTIGNIVASGIIQYPDDATYEANEQGAPIEGNIYYNTTIKQLRYYSDGAWSTILDDDSLQTLINKTIDADNNTITNLEDDNIKVGAAINAEKIHDGSVDNTEFGHLDGVTANIQTQLDGKQETSEKGQPNGYASLDGAGKIPSAQIPPIALTDVSVVADNTARDALTVEEGDVAQTLDSGKWWIYDGTTWQELSTPAAVTSVNGQTGGVSLSIDDLTDVDTTTAAPSFGDILEWDGSNWTPTANSAAANPNIVTISQASTGGSYNVLATDDIILVDGSSGTLTANLPTAAGITGKYYTFKKISADLAFAVIQPFGPQTIDGENTDRVTHLWESLTIVSDGTNWLITEEVVRGQENVIETNILNSTVNTIGTITDLTFTGLEVGKIYEVTGSFALGVNVGAVDNAVYVDAVHDGNVVGRAYLEMTNSGDTGEDQTFYGIAFKFEATNTTLTFDAVSASATSFIIGTGSRNATFVQLEKRNDNPNYV